MTDRLHSFTLGDVVRENSRNFPNDDAIVCGDERFTYPEVEDRVNRVAQHLLSMGVRKGDHVAWVGLNCHRLIEMVFACAKLGAIAAPLNWRLSDDELTTIASEMMPRVVYLDSTQAHRPVPDGTQVVVHDDPAYERTLLEAPAFDPEYDVDDELPVLQIMTAAFAGKPRGAQLTSRGITSQNIVLAGVGVVDPANEVYLASGPMFHIGVLIKLFAIFHWGGTCIVAPRTDAEELCAVVERERVTSAYVFTPTIREMGTAARNGAYDLTSLRDTMGGTPPEDLAAEWYAMTSCVAPVQPPVIGYGASETTGMVTYQHRRPAGQGLFGRPSPTVCLRIVDPAGNEAGVGEVGEIVVRGPQVMAGYFGTEPVDPDGWRHTGDLGRRELDGTIVFIGPLQEIIKSAMENIYPAEVEAVLRQHGAIADACVIGVDDAEWGQSVRAVIELVDGADPPHEREVIEFVRAKIASYKKPRSVVVVDALPRADGRVDRDAVKAAHL